MMKCSVCFEVKTENDVSKCSNCMESGITCHACEVLWAQHSNDPSICTICKNKTKEGVSPQATTIYVQHTAIRSPPDIEVVIQGNTARSNTNRSNTDRSNTDRSNTNNDDNVSCKDFNSFSKVSCWFVGAILISYLFSAFSYYMVFRFKKNLFTHLHIALGCGAIFGIPALICFRKTFKHNCLRDE